MEVLKPYLQEYGLLMLVAIAILYVMYLLVRSFRRNLLVAQGQARMAIHQFELGPSSWVGFIKLLLVISLLIVAGVFLRYYFF